MSSAANRLATRTASASEAGRPGMGRHGAGGMGASASPRSIPGRLERRLGARRRSVLIQLVHLGLTTVRRRTGAAAVVKRGPGRGSKEPALPLVAVLKRLEHVGAGPTVFGWDIG